MTSLKLTTFILGVICVAAVPPPLPSPAPLPHPQTITSSPAPRTFAPDNLSPTPPPKHVPTPTQPTLPTERPPVDLYACSLPAVVGPCWGYFPRFHFDLLTEKCHGFIYGGCGGNANNFETLKECEAFGKRCIKNKDILGNLDIWDELFKPPHQQPSH